MKFKKITSALLAFLLFTLFVLPSQAQYIPYNAYSAGELNIGARGGEFLPFAEFTNFSRGQFKVGVALRLNAFIAGKKRYITAPAILTSGKTGPSVFFADQIPENIDTIIFASSKNVSVNVAFLMEYSFTQNWAAGFNIDLGGISFGPKVDGQFQDLGNERVKAKPTPFNLLLVSDNDRGSLNSLLYAKYFMSNEPYYFKAGASFYFNENKTLTMQRLNNDRFRYKSLMPFVGAGYLLNQPLFQ